MARYSVQSSYYSFSSTAAGRNFKKIKTLHCGVCTLVFLEAACNRNQHGSGALLCTVKISKILN